ncbi:hypothetical protein HDU98_009527 [Podochytrium sp. JEL0797]|nr:hypothetical protein HDU98_009527 [Podochytrium sp. JEL0797]
MLLGWKMLWKRSGKLARPIATRDVIYDWDYPTVPQRKHLPDSANISVPQLNDPDTARRLETKFNSMETARVLELKQNHQKRSNHDLAADVLKTCVGELADAEILHLHQIQMLLTKALV